MQRARNNGNLSFWRVFIGHVAPFYGLVAIGAVVAPFVLGAEVVRDPDYALGILGFVGGFTVLSALTAISAVARERIRRPDSE